jgi:hypothetical protein
MEARQTRPSVASLSQGRLRGIRAARSDPSGAKGRRPQDDKLILQIGIEIYGIDN